MNSPTEARLKQAEEAFFGWRLTETYNLLRRFFDRIPFKPQPEHTKYIGMFAITLLELGKDSQLDFYQNEIEKKYLQLRSTGLGYQLGHIKMFRGDLKGAQKLFEMVIRSCEDQVLVIKSKMCLMYILCDGDEPDYVSCRNLFESIKTPEDQQLKDLLVIWNVNILRYEKSYQQAEATILELIKRTDPTKNWYVYFSAKTILGWLYIDMGKTKETQEAINEMKRLMGSHHFKSISKRINALENALRKFNEFTPVHLVEHRNLRRSELKHEQKSIRLNQNSTTDQLIKLLLNRKHVSQQDVATLLQFENFPSRKASQSIQSKLSSVRKKLKQVGLPPHSIVLEEEGYRFVPEVTKEAEV